MLRALLIAVTLLPIACDKSAQSGPSVVAGAAAGTVVDVAGKTTATRGGATRDLVKGDAITGDDVIATGADGSVTIVLAHNNARWVLAANKSYRVSDSLAWSLPKADGSATTVAGDTSSAGRHSERQSADTASSVATGGAAGSGSAAIESDPDVADRKTTTTTTTPNTGHADKQRADEVKRRAAEEEQRRKVEELQRSLEKSSDDQTRAAVKAKIEAERREAEERKVYVGGNKDRDKDVVPKNVTKQGKCSPDDPLCDDDFGPPPAERARAIFLGDKELRACTKAAKVTISCADKKCTIQTTTVDATVTACVAKRVTVLSGSVPGGKYDLVLEF